MQTSLNLFLIACLTTVFLVLVGCEKIHIANDNPYAITYEANGLPTYSEIGKGSFGFLLDDTAWLPGCGKWLDPSGAALYVDRAQISAKDFCGREFSRTLHMSMPKFVEGTHYLDDHGFDAYYIDYNPGGKSYISSQKGRDRCTFEILHYDTEKQILSGKFNLVLYRVVTSWTPYGILLSERDQYLNLNDSIVIKDGRFDVVHR